MKKRSFWCREERGAREGERKEDRDEGERGGSCLFPNYFKESIVDDKDLGEDNKTVFEDRKQDEAAAAATKKKKLFKAAIGRRRKQSEWR